MSGSNSSQQKLRCYDIQRQMQMINANEDLKKLLYFIRIIKDDDITSLEIVENLIVKKNCINISMVLEEIKRCDLENIDSKSINQNLTFDERLESLIGFVSVYESINKELFNKYMDEAKSYIKSDNQQQQSNSYSQQKQMNQEKKTQNPNQFQQPQANYDQQSDYSNQIKQDNRYNEQNRYNQQYDERLYQDRKVEQIQLKQGLSLPLIRLQANKDGDQQYQYYGQQMNNIKYKNIIFIGQRDEGKTTLLNAFVNYYFGITWNDKFRLIVADQEKTIDISHYYIEPYNQRNYGIHLIDTPGNYGQDDKLTIEKVSKYIQENKQSIDIIVICFNAAHTRLTVEANEMLESIVQIIGTEFAKKIIVARTFFPGGKVDQSILTSNESPFYTISTQLSQNCHLEFNGASIVKITTNSSAKVYYDASIENFKKVEGKMLPYNQYSNQQGKNILTTTQPFNNVDQYSQLYQDSYNQLKVLFMQNLRIYYTSGNQQSLTKFEKQIQMFALNCTQCNITCFVGFKSEQAANDFFSKELNGSCYCGCSQHKMVIENKQLYYTECSNNGINWQNSNSTSKIFAYLFKLFQMKEKINQKNEYQFIEILQQEELKDSQILSKFQTEFLGQQKFPQTSAPNFLQQYTQTQNSNNSLNQTNSNSSFSQGKQQQNQQMVQGQKQKR